MSESRAISTRLIGEIFVERGLITHEQLAQALQVQSDSGGMLGEILVASFGVSRIALAGVLAEQWSAVERQPDVERSDGRTASSALQADAPARSVEEAMEEMARKPLGEIFVERGMATGEQLEHALEIQRESGERLGEILVRLGVIERLELAGALAEQWSGLQKLRPPAPKKVESWQELGGATGVPQDGGGGDLVSAAELKRIGESVASLEQQVAALASRPDPDLTSLRATTRAVEERLADLEGRLHDIPAADALADVSSAVERLERAVGEAASGQALDEVRRVADSATGELRPRLEELAAGVTALAARVDELAGAELPTVRGSLDETRSVLDGLGARLEQVAVDRTELDGLAADLRARLAQADGLLAALDGRLDEALARDPAAGLDGALAERPTRSELDEAVANLGGRLTVLAATLDGLGAHGHELTALTERVDAVERSAETRGSELGDRIAELGAQLEGLRGAAQSGIHQPSVAGDVTGQLDQLRASLDALRADGSEALDAAVVELRGWLEAVQGRLDDAAGRAELAALAGDLRARIDALAVRAEAVPTGASPDLEELRGRVAGLAERIDTSRAELRVEHDSRFAEAHRRLGELEAELRGRIASLQAHVEHTAGADDLARIEAILAGHDAALAERASSSALAETAAALDARLAGLESRREALDHQLADLPSRVELQAAVANASGAADAARLGAGVDSIAEELRAALAHLQGRIDELAAGQGHFGGRLAAIELAAGSSGAVDQVADGLASLRAEVERQAALADERTKVTERAIRKGLAGLGERLVASEQAYVEAGSSLRRAVERLGAAVVEADARLEGAPLDPPTGGHVAFVPTTDGYRLRSVAGPAPAVGELVELVPGEAPFRVVRATLSPLPLDRRVCVYLEPVGPA